MTRPATRFRRFKETKMRRSFLGLALASAAIATPAIATTPFQDTVALDRAIAAFTGRGVGEAGGARAMVDARLKLAACPTVSLAWRAQNHDSVVVTCTGPQWRVFVPIQMAAPPVITPAALAPAALAAPRAAPVIKRGDPVTIAAGSPGFSITRDGIAMADAAPGARFLVKVDDTRTPVQAVAIEAGRATLPGWSE